LCWSDIQVAWLHRTLFVLIRYPSWLTSSTWISDQHKQCPMKSVNLDIWSIQSMSYEVSQLRYLINTNNVLWKLTDFIEHCLCWSDIQVDWLHRTVFVLIRYLSWLTSYDIVCVDQISKLTDFIGQRSMKSVNLDIWSTQTMSYEVSQLDIWSTQKMSYEVSQLRYLDWLHRTLFVLIRYLSWLTS
jgi:hypothetical protein